MKIGQFMAIFSSNKELKEKFFLELSRKFGLSMERCNNSAKTISIFSPYITTGKSLQLLSFISISHQQCQTCTNEILEGEEGVKV